LLFLALLYFANDLYHLLALPLLQSLPQGSQMIATDVTTPFIIPMKLTLYVSLFLAIPYVLYQIWAFVAPGSISMERKLVLPLVVASTRATTSASSSPTSSSSNAVQFLPVPPQLGSPWPPTSQAI
jgi:Sec-independent protein secretion pathway component TatC